MNYLWIPLTVAVLVTGGYGCLREEEMTERNYVNNGYVQRTVGSGWSSHQEWVREASSTTFNTAGLSRAFSINRYVRGH